MVDVVRGLLRLQPNPGRVLARPFIPGRNARLRNLVQRLLAMPTRERIATIQAASVAFTSRHRSLSATWEHHAGLVADVLVQDGETALAKRVRRLSTSERQALGAWFTQEYAVEAAALCNPSMVPHPDQSGLPPGALRVLLSLRAVGEGHLSSVLFHRGVIDQQGRFTLDRPADWLEQPSLLADVLYDRALCTRKLAEMGCLGPAAQQVIDRLSEHFTRAQLETAIRTAGFGPGTAGRQVIEPLRWIIDSNYEVSFPEHVPASARCLFPVAGLERAGMEDARFVRFVDDDGSTRWYATYTAYDGRTVLPQLLETEDFLNFRMRSLNGPAAQGKGLALFPRRIDDLYVMLGRQDGESLSLMRSEHPHFWHESQPLCGPREPWDLVIIGNCGSPLETPAGWLVITHGVGPMRRYCLGAMLLDLKDPAKILGRLRLPLMEPAENEREGYVPNVVYSCGSLIHDGRLFIPFASSDTRCDLARIDLDALLGQLLADGP